MRPRWLPAMIALLMFTGCSKDTITREEYQFQQDGIQVSVHASVKKVSPDILLRNLFDGDARTACVLQAGYEPEIRIDFSKPVYVKSVTLQAGESTGTQSPKPARQVSVMAYNDAADIFPAGGSKIELQAPGTATVVDLNKDFLKVLKVRSLAVEIDKKAGHSPDQALVLSKIRLGFSQVSDFQPTMTVSAIKERFAKAGGQWQFRAGGGSEREQKLVLMNLVHYALQGDRAAEKMLNDYSPPQADEGEWASFLTEWYETTKKSR